MLTFIRFKLLLLFKRIFSQRIRGHAVVAHIMKIENSPQEMNTITDLQTIIRRNIRFCPESWSGFTANGIKVKAKWVKTSFILLKK